MSCFHPLRLLDSFRKQNFHSTLTATSLSYPRLKILKPLFSEQKYVENNIRMLQGINFCNDHPNSKRLSTDFLFLKIDLNTWKKMMTLENIAVQHADGRWIWNGLQLRRHRNTKSTGNTSKPVWPHIYVFGKAMLDQVASIRRIIVYNNFHIA